MIASCGCRVKSYRAEYVRGKWFCPGCASEEKNRRKLMKNLKGMRCYLCGAIGYVEKDEWRDAMGIWLEKKGVVVLNPLAKPLLGFNEDLENKERRLRLKEEENWGQIREEMREIRHIDLRMVDISDFIIVHVDIETYSVGTWEEVTLANRQKKPVLIMVKQGRKQCPDWVFGMVDTIFSDWKSLKSYLIMVDKEGTCDKRWCFFRF